MGAVDSTEGQVALALAANIDHPRAGMSMQGDSRALREAMDVLRDARPLKKDTVDDAASRRAAKLRSVG